MSISHINSVRYDYTAGGSRTTKTVSKTETSGAEMNISETITTSASDGEDPIDIEYFEFQAAAQAKSVYMRLDGFDAYVSGGGASLARDSMATLINGEPYVWSYNAASGFPEGATNPMLDDTTKITITPFDGTAEALEGTFTLKVLYDPTA
jgi:hypothetical protein